MSLSRLALSGGALLAAVAACMRAVDVRSLDPAALFPPLPIALLFSALGYLLTSRLLVATSPLFIKARLFGIDLNKPTTKRDANGVLVRPYEGHQVPEAMGAVCCTVYLVCMFIFLPFPFLHDFASWGSSVGGAWRDGATGGGMVGGGGGGGGGGILGGVIGGGGAGAAADASLTASWVGRLVGGGAAMMMSTPYLALPVAHLSKFLCALLAICCMCFLGFADDLFDLRWRDRLWLPLAASLPLLVVYAVDGGGTTVVVPKLLVPLLGATTIRLGLAYYGFMSALSIFCTNSINILAGVNGLEVGQSVVIGATVLVNNAIQLWRWPEGPLHDNNLFSLYLMLPFLGTSLALLRHNWYPSKVFVGDTYCYFAGMTFAVAGILGHNTKTMLLFFLPQLLNFVYSVPQLFRIIPCPRHRMPAYLAKEDKLCNSFAEVEPAELGPLGKGILWLCENLRLARVVRTPGSTVVKVSNFTIINYALYVLGPMHEATLTSVLLLFQVASSCLALFIRYKLASLFYDVVK